jgi:murein DD-endopeptidase MepM/ murein hydrolase activator NlpD
VVVLRVPGAPEGLSGDWGGRPLAFFPVAGGAAALVGIDLDTPPGRVAWRVAAPGAGGSPEAVQAGTVAIRARAFETQRLTLPSRQVDLDEPTLARVRAEQAALQAVLADSAPLRLWQGRFRTPVPGGRPTGGFGLRRLINGQPRSPHAGFDWAAPAGTPVHAASGGRAVLVAEHFFAGRLVVLDHGLGLFTLYFHLEDVRVAGGEAVEGGQVLGTVGMSGRATGPHLHLSVILGGARVDPEALLALDAPPGA